jgi:hypothetical protein
MNNRFYEIQLSYYSTLYKLLGVIEVQLRSSIPITLSHFAMRLGRDNWISVIPVTTTQREVLRKAINANGGEKSGSEFFLPFSFWRYLFTKRHFNILWRPALFEVFPGIQDKKSVQSYKEVCDCMHRAYLIRNRVAHFDFRGAGRFEAEVAALIWLIAMMQIDKDLVKT